MKSKPKRAVLRVGSRCATAGIGWISLDGVAVRCALGRSGTGALKREGDGATPRGRFGLVEVRYRPDRVRRPRTGLPVRPHAPRDGWCDATGDPNYNRDVQHPYPASAERMWRDDGLYDIVIVTSHNRRPRIQGAGSAIFIHVARPGFRPTEGCVALERQALIRLLARLGAGSMIDIGGSRRPTRRSPVKKIHGPTPERGEPAALR